MYRKDRVKTSGGGVLIAVKNEYNNEELDADCEIVWTKLHRSRQQHSLPVFILQTHVSDEESINQFEISVMRASSINNASLVIVGGFDFTGWDWKATSIKGGTAYTGLHYKFLGAQGVSLIFLHT